MNQKIFNNSIKPTRFVKEYLQIINCRYLLTTRELEILEIVVKRELDILKNKAVRLNRRSFTKLVQSETGINRHNLSKHLDKLIQKNAVIRTDKDLIYLTEDFIISDLNNNFTVTFNLSW